MRRKRRGALHLTVAFGLCASSVSPAGAQTARQVTASYADGAIIVDGNLDEAIWHQAEIAGDFVQAEPREGQPATEQTEVRAVYDADHLYFGISCLHSVPGSVIVNQLARDFETTDTDVFGIALDTFHDRRNTFTFVTNPGGAQRDEQSFDDGRFLNLNWDGIWEVATRIGPDGWTAEVRIPFKTLRVNPATQSFGVNFFRSIRHKNELVYWSAVPRAFTIHRASLGGDLVGLSGIRPGRSLRLKPGMVTRFEHTSGAVSTRKVDPDVSLDAKYGLTQGLTLDLTLRPEFSQAEVDSEQVNLTRFNLFFPEKRDFFLENEGFFHFGDIQGERGATPQAEMRLFYTRRVGLSENNQPVPILGGGRVSGRIGAYTLGALNIQQGESASTPASNFSVLRIRRHLFANSDIGMIYVGRESSGDRDHRAIGVDANFRFRQHLTSNFYVTKTANPDLHGRDTSTKAAVQWTDSSKMFQLVFTDTGENFRPEAGFIERSGLRHYRASYDLNHRPKSGRLVRALTTRGILRYSTDPGNRLLARDDNFVFLTSFHDGSRIQYALNLYVDRLDEPFEVRRGFVVPVGLYKTRDHVFIYNSNRSKPLAVSFNYRRGSFWDGDKTTVGASVFVIQSASLNARLSYNLNRVDLPDGSFDTGLTGLKVDYFFSPRALLSAFVQRNSDTDRWITNVRFRLTHRPLSDIFLVYTEDNQTAIAQNSRVLLLKYTHSFGF